MWYIGGTSACCSAGTFFVEVCGTVRGECAEKGLTRCRLLLLRGVVSLVSDPVCISLARLSHFELSWHGLGWRRAFVELARAVVGDSVIFSRPDNAAFDMTVHSAHRYNQVGMVWYGMVWLSQAQAGRECKASTGLTSLCVRGGEKRALSSPTFRCGVLFPALIHPSPSTLFDVFPCCCRHTHASSPFSCCFHDASRKFKPTPRLSTLAWWALGRSCRGNRSSPPHVAGLDGCPGTGLDS